MFWEGAPMHFYLCLYSELPMLLILYYHTNWYNTTHRKLWLEFLSLLPLKHTPHLIVLISPSTSMFIPTIYICLLDIVGFCYLNQSPLIPLGTLHDNILYIKLILLLYFQVDFLPVPVIYILDHILYFYLTFERCIIYRQFLLSHTTLLLLVPLVLYV